MACKGTPEKYSSTNFSGMKCIKMQVHVHFTSCSTNHYNMPSCWQQSIQDRVGSARTEFIEQLSFITRSSLTYMTDGTFN